MTTLHCCNTFLLISQSCSRIPSSRMLEILDIELLRHCKECKIIPEQDEKSLNVHNFQKCSVKLRLSFSFFKKIEEATALCSAILFPLVKDNVKNWYPKKCLDRISIFHTDWYLVPYPLSQKTYLFVFFLKNIMHASTKLSWNQTIKK